MKRNRELNHPELVRSLKKAYSAERAACYAYIGHAGSLKDAEEIGAVRQIEQDEWDHRAHVLAIKDMADVKGQETARRALEVAARPATSSVSE